MISYDTPHPPPKLETNDKKTIITKLKQASKNLALIKINATKHIEVEAHIRKLCSIHNLLHKEDTCQASIPLVSICFWNISSSSGESKLLY